MKKLKHLTWFLVCASVIGACNLSAPLSNRDFSDSYKLQRSDISVQYKVVHDQRQNSRLYYKLPKSSLLSEVNDNGLQSLSFRFRYRLLNSYSSVTPLDSGTVFLSDIILPDTARWVRGYLNLPLIIGSNYIIDISLLDINSNRTARGFVATQKTRETAPDFIALFDANSEPYFKSYVTRPGRYYVETALPERQLHVKFYQREFPVASPPFAVINPRPFNFNPDSSFWIDRQINDQYELPLAKEGLYLITRDSNERSGTTVFLRNQFYPKTKTVMSLALPLRYITTSEEYAKLMEGGVLKKNIDSYWLKVAGSPDRARELIAAFYGRVEFANEAFHSFTEGWKSDRGMCYIVFGPPDVVTRTTSTEKWTYGEEGRYNALSLTFTRVTNPFTDNDYRLGRSVTYKNPWYRAVEFWRQGRVITYKN